MVKFKNVSEIKGFEAFDNYAICSDGKLMNLKKQKFLQGNTSGQYLKYTMNSVKDGVSYSKTIEAHKIVALAFVDGYFEGAVVDHIIHISPCPSPPQNFFLSIFNFVLVSLYFMWSEKYRETL